MAPRKMQDKMINKIEDIQPLQGAFKALPGAGTPVGAIRAIGQA
jgi:hypothetical protein